MPTDAPAKPIVKGPVDGNIFAVLGAATTAMKRGGLRDKVEELQTKVLNADSYNEALRHCMEYVEFDL